MTISKNILITGASGAIGAALAYEYAAAGSHLILHGRNEIRLEEIAKFCLTRGATVDIGVFDIADIPMLMAWIEAIDNEHPIDLVIANQGVNINIGPDARGELWAEADHLIDINLRATMAMMHALTPRMRRRKQGQIALISSLAAYFGLPMTPAYCASKAAVKAYGEALRGWLGPTGIGVTTVMPGYVASAMCDAMPGPKSYLWTAERAAKKIKKGIDTNKARVSFPFPLNLGTWFLSVLPPDVSIKILGWMGYRA
jgi:short-subunit dehydrogenase